MSVSLVLMMMMVMMMMMMMMMMMVVVVVVGRGAPCSRAYLVKFDPQRAVVVGPSVRGADVLGAALDEFLVWALYVSCAVFPFLVVVPRGKRGRGAGGGLLPRRHRARTSRRR